MEEEGRGPLNNTAEDDEESKMVGRKGGREEIQRKWEKKSLMMRQENEQGKGIMERAVDKEGQEEDRRKGHRKITGATVSLYLKSQ